MYLINASYRCNFEDRPEGPCIYCYNTPLRRATQKKEKVDLPAIERTLRREYAKHPMPITLHGGEPLYWPKKILERLLRLSFELSGQSALQTNGSLIDDEKIELFKEYKTHVGVSIDGYWPANEWRGKTEKCTQLVIENIFRLKKAGIPVRYLITLHKGNANPERIKFVERFIYNMAKEGISGRINLIVHPDPAIELTPREAKWAYLRLAKFILANNIPEVDPFCEIVQGFLDQPKGCEFNNCDPYTTLSGIVINPRGTLLTCSRSQTFQITTFVNPQKPIYTRWEILSQTDCKDCPYGGKICFGGCPVHAIDWDWRNKTRFCEAYRALFEFYEKKLKTLAPFLTLRTDPNFRERPQRPGKETDECPRFFNF